VGVRTGGIPEAFLAHAKRGEVLADIGLTPAEIAGRIGAALARIDASATAPVTTPVSASVAAPAGGRRAATARPAPPAARKEKDT
jgi:1-deoxy-D-xylulose-5-phosphate synthase